MNIEWAGQVTGYGDHVYTVSHAWDGDVALCGSRIKPNAEWVAAYDNPKPRCKRCEKKDAAR